MGDHESPSEMSGPPEILISGSNKSGTVKNKAVAKFSYMLEHPSIPHYEFRPKWPVP
jgi:hypothetical protein